MQRLPFRLSGSNQVNKARAQAQTHIERRHWRRQSKLRLSDRRLELSYCSKKRKSVQTESWALGTGALYLSLADKELATWQTSSSKSEGDKWHYNRIEWREGTAAELSTTRRQRRRCWRCSEREGTRSGSFVTIQQVADKDYGEDAIANYFLTDAFLSTLFICCIKSKLVSTLQIIGFAIYLIIAPLHAHSTSLHSHFYLLFSAHT